MQAFRLLLILGAALLLAGAETRLGDPRVAEAAFPGENGKITFTKVLSGNYEIFTMNPDGSEQKNITNNPATDSSGRWSADGTRMVFSSNRGGSPGIYVMRADGTDVQLVTSTDGFYPSFSPDGTKVAFQAQDPPNSNPGIFVVNVDGSGLVRRTPQTVNANRPSWSPDGTQIAFGGPESLFVMNADGSNLHALGNAGFQSLYPDWSPDGTSIVYHGVLGSDAGSAGIYVYDLNAGTNQQLTDAIGFEPAWSPDGTKIAFSTGNVQTQTFRISVMGAGGSNPMDITSGPSDSSPHWSPAPPPVVFIHGFLGSRIECGSDTLWPDVPPGFEDMELAADGVSPAAGACAATVGDTIDSFLGSDIYGSAMTFLNGLRPGGAYFFAWDWRKSPEPSIALLDSFIDNVRSMHGDQKVVIMAHSYGGLLARWYIDNTTRADKVERVLTVGTPAWGAPKALFPLFAGIETPQFSTLDSLVILDDAALKEFAKSLFGNYFLFPSASYGPWLTLLPSNTPAGQQDVLDYVTELGGNQALLSQALNRHASTIDSVPGNVPFEVIAGAGLLTIAGVRIDPGGHVIIEYDNGDGTVPIRSAARGMPGSGNPNAAHTHYPCGVSHVPLPGDPQITDAVSGYLLSGAPIDGLPAGACSASGNQFRVFSLSALPAASGGAGGAAGAMTPQQAEVAGLVDYLDLPDEKFIITGADFPDIVLPPGEFLEVTPVEDGEKGAPTLYGPLTGDVTISDGDTGPLVMDDGAPAPAIVSGDVDCSGGVTSLDALQVLLTAAGLPANADCIAGGDVDCSEAVDSIDALRILQHIAMLPINLPGGCREIGT